MQYYPVSMLRYFMLGALALFTTEGLADNGLYADFIYNGNVLIFTVTNELDLKNLEYQITLTQEARVQSSDASVAPRPPQPLMKQGIVAHHNGDNLEFSKTTVTFDALDQYNTAQIRVFSKAQNEEAEFYSETFKLDEKKSCGEICCCIFCCCCYLALYS